VAVLENELTIEATVIKVLDFRTYERVTMGILRVSESGVIADLVRAENPDPRITARDWMAARALMHRLQDAVMSHESAQRAQCSFGGAAPAQSAGAGPHGGNPTRASAADGRAGFSLKAFNGLGANEVRLDV
jgi:hypothetical protein